VTQRVKNSHFLLSKKLNIKSALARFTSQQKATWTVGGYLPIGITQIALNFFAGKENALEIEVALPTRQGLTMTFAKQRERKINYFF
jgi:hypothetical protein